MTITLTIKNFLIFLGLIFGLFLSYQGYKTWNYLYGGVGKNESGGTVTRSVLLDQLLAERFSKSQVKGTEDGTQPVK